MNYKIETQITLWIESFVETDLAGRYRDHCSDLFLTKLLVKSFHLPTLNTHVSCGESFGLDDHAAYHAACWIFEGILEDGCKAGGNGHHVAQRFQAYMVKQRDLTVANK